MEGRKIRSPEGIGNNHELGNIVGFAPDGQYQGHRRGDAADPVTS